MTARCSRLTLVLSLALPFAVQAEDTRFALVIHGGAGTLTREAITPEIDAVSVPTSIARWMQVQPCCRRAAKASMPWWLR